MAHPVPGYQVTTAYKKKGSWAAGYHTGVDIAAPMGTKVHAVKGGTVIHVGWGGWGRAYGAHIIIATSVGRFGYCHLSSTAVRRGATVSTGQYIGKIGSTGNSTGPHLHCEGRRNPWRYNNRIFNPETYFEDTISITNLKFGKRNDDVKILQQALNEKTETNLPTTGYYGTLTDAAVRAHQRSQGWTPDRKGRSYVGPKQAKILEL